MARSTRSRGLVLRQAVELAEKRCRYSETCTLALMFWQLLLRPGSWMGAVKQEYLRHHAAAPPVQRRGAVIGFGPAELSAATLTRGRRGKPTKERRSLPVRCCWNGCSRYVGEFKLVGAV